MGWDGKSMGMEMGMGREKVGDEDGDGIAQEMGWEQMEMRKRWGWYRDGAEDGDGDGD